MTILPSGITEKFRVTHIVKPSILDAQWKADCAQYTGSKAPVCRKLLDGSDYCEASSSYVPPYCFAGSTVDTYFANQIWNYSSDFITRAVYIGDDLYTLGTSQIRRWNLGNTATSLSTLKFKTTTTSSTPMPVSIMVK